MKILQILIVLTWATHHTSSFLFHHKEVKSRGNEHNHGHKSDAHGNKKGISMDNKDHHRGFSDHRRDHQASNTNHGSINGNSHNIKDGKLRSTEGHFSIPGSDKRKGNPSSGHRDQKSVHLDESPPGYKIPQHYPKYKIVIDHFGKPGSPRYHEIISISESNIMGRFKYTPAKSKNPNGYSIEALATPKHLVSGGHKSLYTPKVIHSEGKNKPPILIIGPQENQKYFMMLPNPSKSHSYKITPLIKMENIRQETDDIYQKQKSQNKTFFQEKENKFKPHIQEKEKFKPNFQPKEEFKPNFQPKDEFKPNFQPKEELKPNFQPKEELKPQFKPKEKEFESIFDDLPENPKFKTVSQKGHKHPYQIITLGSITHRQFFKKTSHSNDLNNYDIEPYDPRTRNNKPDPKDLWAPEVIPQGKPGTPGYSPVILIGSRLNRVSYRLIQHPDNPNQLGFIPVKKAHVQGVSKYLHFNDLPRCFHPRKHTEQPSLDISPDFGELEFSDLPENPLFTKVIQSGQTHPHTLISIGKPPYRRTFKKTPGPSGNINDYEIAPYDPNTHDYKPDPDDLDAPKVYSNGKHGTPDYSPVVEIGPQNKRKLFRLIPHPIHPDRFGFIPVTILPNRYNKQSSFIDKPRVLNLKRHHISTTPEIEEGEQIFDDLPDNIVIRNIQRPGFKKPIQIISVGRPPYVQYFEKKPGPSSLPNDFILAAYDPKRPLQKPNPLDPKTLGIYPAIGKPGSTYYQHPIIRIGPKAKPKYFKISSDPKHPNDPSKVKFIPVRLVKLPNKNRAIFENSPRMFHYYIATYEPEEGDPIFDDLPLNPIIKNIQHPNGKILYQIISVGNPAHRQYFMKKPGPTGKRDDFKLTTYEPIKPDHKSNPNSPDSPEVYPAEGRLGSSNYYHPVIRIGTKVNPKYFKVKPDYNYPHDPTKIVFIPVMAVRKHIHDKIFFKNIPRHYHTYHTTPKSQKTTTPEPKYDEVVFTDLPYQPFIKAIKRPGQTHTSYIIGVGRPPDRKYFEKKPGPSKNPYDYIIVPFDPKNPNKIPDPKNSLSPKVYPGSHKFQPPVIQIGPKNKPIYYKVVPDTKHLNDPSYIQFIPVMPVKSHDKKSISFIEKKRQFYKYNRTTKQITHHSGKTQKPYKDDFIFTDLPENPTVVTIQRPGQKYKIQIISVGKQPFRQQFKKLPGVSGKAEDFILQPFDSKRPDGKPDPKNPNSGKVYPAVGKPGSSLYQPPVIEIGPINDRKTFFVQLDPIYRNDPTKIIFIPVKKSLVGTHLRFIPLLRVTQKYHTTYQKHQTSHKPPIWKTIVQKTKSQKTTSRRISAQTTKSHRTTSHRTTSQRIMFNTIRSLRTKSPRFTSWRIITHKTTHPRMKSQRTSPQRTTTHKTTSQSTTSQSTTSQSTMTQSTTPQSTTSKSTTSQSTTTQSTTPQSTTSKSTTSQSTTTQSTTAQSTTSKSTTSKSTMSQRTTHPTSQRTTSQPVTALIPIQYGHFEKLKITQKNPIPYVQLQELNETEILSFPNQTVNELIIPDFSIALNETDMTAPEINFNMEQNLLTLKPLVLSEITENPILHIEQMDNMIMSHSNIDFPTGQTFAPTKIKLTETVMKSEPSQTEFPLEHELSNLPEKSKNPDHEFPEHLTLEFPIEKSSKSKLPGIMGSITKPGHEFAEPMLLDFFINNTIKEEPPTIPGVSTKTGLGNIELPIEPAEKSEPRGISLNGSTLKPEQTVLQQISTKSEQEFIEPLPIKKLTEPISKSGMEITSTKAGHEFTELPNQFQQTENKKVNQTTEEPENNVSLPEDNVSLPEDNVSLPEDNVSLPTRTFPPNENYGVCIKEFQTCKQSRHT